jgi:hypothetical protein
MSDRRPWQVLADNSDIRVIDREEIVRGFVEDVNRKS